MTILQMHNRDGHPCPDCGIGILKAELVKYTIPLDGTAIPVQHQALVCQNLACRNIICDYRAIAAQENAVHAYVTSKQAIQGANEPSKQQPAGPQDPGRDN